MNTIYITKYAMSRGILEAEGEVHGDGIARVQLPGCYAQYFHGKEWHLTLDEAQRRAQSMRVSKLALHTKAMSKLASMTFDTTTKLK